jgi:hypothetical protein
VITVLQIRSVERENEIIVDYCRVVPVCPGCNIAFEGNHGYDFRHASIAKAVLVILNLATCNEVWLL